MVHFSATAVYENEGGTSHIARDLDEEMTLEQCLYGIMLESANECSYAVAEHVGGGDYQKFYRYDEMPRQQNLAAPIHILITVTVCRIRRMWLVPVIWR